MKFLMEENSLGELSLTGLGLQLDIKPHLIFKQMITEEMQKEIDLMLENSYKSALDNFCNSEENNKEDRNAFYNKEKFSELIKKISTLERLCNKIHSDSESIELTATQNEIRIYCFSVWKYCKDYGYVESKKIQF